MKILIVGGNFDGCKRSSVLDKMAFNLPSKINDFPSVVKVYNGHRPNEEDISGNDLILWMPDIGNDKSKKYPKKDKGSVLICSKVIHGNRTEVDAISRIFKMHGNAVICIYKYNDLFLFKLIDALGNVWSETSDIKELMKDIIKFYTWSNGQIRISYTKRNLKVPIKIEQEFIDINTNLADRVENSLGDRYFGNFSTRCMKLFPSLKINNSFMFSPRNSDKRRLTSDDFVLVDPPYYYGDRKPSVDTPVQVRIYEEFEDIHYMIHGHAFMTNPYVPTTENYFPCGDMREADEILELFGLGYRYINLKNHGFLIAENSLENMEYYMSKLNFKINKFLSVDKMPL